MNAIANWFKGVIGVAPPDYALVLEAAERWGVAPWVVESQCSERWWRRWLRYRAGRIEATK